MAESGLNTVSESTKEFLETNEYAQKAQEIGNQAVEGATNFLSWARHEVETQYQNMKQQAKDSVKNDLNARVDKVFNSF